LLTVKLTKLAQIEWGNFFNYSKMSTKNYFLLLVLLLTFGCKKDPVATSKELNPKTSKAKLDVFWANLELDWKKSKIVEENTEFVLYSFPVMNETLFNNGRDKRAFLMLYESKVDKSTRQLLQVLESNVTFRSDGTSDVFSGIVYQVLPSGRFINQYILENGQIVSKFKGVTTNKEIKTYMKTYWIDPWGSNPSNFGDDDDVWWGWGDGDDKPGWDNYDVYDSGCSEIVPCGGSCPNGLPKDKCCHTWESPCDGDETGFNPCEDICPDCICEFYGVSNITVECDCSSAGGSSTHIFTTIIPEDNDDSNSGGGTSPDGHWSSIINILFQQNDEDPCSDGDDGDESNGIDSELLDIGFETLESSSDILPLPAHVLLDMYGESAPQFIINALENYISGTGSSVVDALYQTSSSGIANTQYDPSNPLHSAVYIAFAQLAQSMNNCVPMDMGGFLGIFDNYFGENFLEQLSIKSQIANNLGVSIGVISGFAANCTGAGEAYSSCILQEMGLAGQDWFYDEEFWSDDLTFPHQDLPSWQDFLSGFPKKVDGKWLYGADEIYAIAGGDVNQIRLDDVQAHPVIEDRTTNNTCALKVSIALNKAGINIPNLGNADDNLGTVQGGDGKYYFLNAKALSKFLIKTFSEDRDDPSYTNPNYQTFSSDLLNGTELSAYLNQEQGILISVRSPNTSSVTGHADLFDGVNCSNQNCNPRGQVYFWKLD